MQLMEEWEVDLRVAVEMLHNLVELELMEMLSDELELGLELDS